MKKIILLLTLGILPSSYLFSTPQTTHNYLHNINPDLYTLLLDIDGILPDEYYYQFISLYDQVLNEVNTESKKFSYNLGYINTRFLVASAGNKLVYYANSSAAHRLESALNTHQELALVHLYLYALTHYPSNIQRLKFYELMTKSNIVANAIYYHEALFLSILHPIVFTFLHDDLEQLKPKS